MAEERIKHDNILGPEQLQFTPGHSGRRIGTPDEYLGWHTAIVYTRNGIPWDSGENVIAEINHGRWIAKCFWCSAGMLTRPDWAVAYCAECGARYPLGSVSFPKSTKDIEAPLLERIMRSQQNWDRRQTAEQLLEENKRAEVMTFRKLIERKKRARETPPEVESQ